MSFSRKRVRVGKRGEHKKRRSEKPPFQQMVDALFAKAEAGRTFKIVNGVVIKCP